jgi:Mg2+ and Co2+ transporter CorA
MKDHANCGVDTLAWSHPAKDGASIQAGRRSTTNNARLSLTPKPRRTMANAFYHLTTVAALAVFCVLLAGLWAMSREGTASLSQKLMRWRCGLQFLAIIIIMLAVYFKRWAGA